MNFHTKKTTVKKPETVTINGFVVEKKIAEKGIHYTITVPLPDIFKETFA